MPAKFFRRRVAAVATAAAMLAAPLAVLGTASSANANPAGTGLVISEVYGGGGNTGATLKSDFIELYNPTNAPISVVGWSVQWRSAGSSGVATAVTGPLTGSVPARGHYLVKQSDGAGGTVPLPTPDFTGATNMGASAGTALLVSNATAVDPGVGTFAAANFSAVVDLVGVASNVYEGASAAPSMSSSTSASRNAAGLDTDVNSADFTAGPPGPQNASDSTNPNAPVVAAVSDKTFTINETITPFTLTATKGSTPYVWSASGLPPGLSLDEASGEVTGTPTVIGASQVTVTVTDAVDATAMASFSITVSPAAGTVMPIASIQGTSTTSPMVGATVTTRGVVTAAYPTGGFNGYVIQTPASGGDLDLGTHTASEGLFVFSPATVTSVAVGDYVEATGPVSEFFGLTQISVAAGGLTQLSEAVTPPKSITNTWPATDTQRETVESMLFAGSGSYTISNTYSTNQYGEFGLALGATPLMQWTDVARPGSAAANAVKADNAARGVTLDDGASINFLNANNTALTPPYISLDKPLRVGETTTFVHPVIIDYRNNGWKLQPTAQVSPAEPGDYPVTWTSGRTSAPADVGGDLTIASFNVLNYFTTLGKGVPGCTAYKDRAGNGITTNSCSAKNGPRGAWDEANLARQQAKIVNAITKLDADVVGLMEIENSLVVDGPGQEDEAVSTLVDALNAKAGTTAWAFVASSTDLPPASEMDVISNAIIYQVDSVTPKGNSHALGDQSGTGEAFVNAREPIAQAFTPRVAGAPFAVVVNHFKSKGSAGPLPGDADTGDGQGASNASRIAQATALDAWIPTLKEQTGTHDVFLAGDFNAYTQEDPLQALYDNGWTDINSNYETGKQSYNFGGMSGSLDHVLANPSALARTTGVDIWSINAPESIALEYSRYNSHGTLFYDESPYRSSDHDPVLVGIGTGAGASAVKATVTPGSIKAQTETATVKVEVTSSTGTPTGMVAALVDGVVVGGADLVNGKADVTVGPFATAGTKVITIKYYGDGSQTPAEGTVSLVVTPAATERHKATVTTTVAPDSVAVMDGRATVSVRVAKASGTPTGAVLALVDGKVVGAAELVAGKTDIALLPFSTVGSRPAEVKYYGDASTKPADSTATVQVVKAEPKLRVRAVTVQVKDKKLKVRIKVSAKGFTPTGTVTVKVRGKKVSKKLTNGKVIITMPLKKVGKNKVKIHYRGDDLTESARKVIRVKVTRR